MPIKEFLKVHDTEYLLFLIESTLSWKLHVEQVLHMLSAACYAFGSVKPYMSQEVIKMVHCACFQHHYFIGNNMLGKLYTQHQIIQNAKEGNWSYRQKQEYRDSCRDLFKKLKILPFR
jgi:hypothetical protein